MQSVIIAVAILLMYGASAATGKLSDWGAMALLALLVVAVGWTVAHQEVRRPFLWAFSLSGGTTVGLTAVAFVSPLETTSNPPEIMPPVGVVVVAILATGIVVGTLSGVLAWTVAERTQGR